MRNATTRNPRNVFTSARLRSESTGTPLACTPFQVRSPWPQRAVRHLQSYAGKGCGGTVARRDQILERGALFDLRVIAEGRFAAGGDGTSGWVADVVVGWAVIRGNARPGLDGP